MNFNARSAAVSRRLALAGDELELAYVELEEYEPIAIGTKGFE